APIPAHIANPPLHAALPICLLLLLRGRRSAPATEAATHSSLGDLHAERDLLLERLRALEFDEGDPEAVAAERRALELRAARVLRAIVRAERAAPAAPVPAAPASSALRGFAWGLGTAAFLGLLVALALHFSKDRSPPAPSMAGAAMALDADPELVGLIARVESEPESVEARLDLIQGLLARERYVDAWPFIQALAATHPDHPRRLLYEATVREAMGHWEIARDLLDRALEGDASLTEAWVRRGLVSFELGDSAAALESWETALRQRPDGRQVLEPVIAEARRRLEEGAPPPARQPAPTRAPSAEAAGESLHIRIDLSSDARARIGEGGGLFVTARPAGVRAGPAADAKEARRRPGGSPTGHGRRRRGGRGNRSPSGPLSPRTRARASARAASASSPPAPRACARGRPPPSRGFSPPPSRWNSGSV